MPGPISEFLTRDHERLDALLARTTADPHSLDLEAFAEFRAGLLRHIAMEEKVLFADAKARRDTELLPLVEQLHADHAAIATLLIPPPTRELIATLRRVLDEHNPLEEEPGGLYDKCDVAAGSDVSSVVARMHAIPPARVSQHLDDPRVHAHIERMLAARRRTT